VKFVLQFIGNNNIFNVLLFRGRNVKKRSAYKSV